MRLLVSTCLVSLTAFGAAQAADLPSRHTPVLSPTPVASWEGFYAGTLFSIGQARFTSSQTVSRTESGFGSNMAAVTGYNFKSGAWIYGLEGDLGFHKLSKSTAGVSGSLVAHQAELLDSGHLRARAGYDFGALLPYAAVGVSYAQGGVRVGEQGAIKTHIGVNVGAGLDWRVDLPVIGRSVLRAEYVYDRFGKENYSYDPLQSAIGIRPDAHMFRFGFINVPKNDSWRAQTFDADWSGSYGGFISGWSRAHVETKTASASKSLNADGALGGIYAGRNFAFGRYIVGIDSAAMFASMKGTGVVPGTSDALSYRNYYETSIRGRAGYAFGRFLPFFAAGISNGRSEQADTSSLSKRVNVSLNAWNIGAGVDYLLTERLSTRIEYLRSTSWKYVEPDFNGTAMRQSRSSDLLRAGFAWHFH
mgnify:CR=1 FL=1